MVEEVEVAPPGERLAGFWEVGPGLEALRLDVTPPSVPDAALRELARSIVRWLACRWPRCWRAPTR